MLQDDPPDDRNYRYILIGNGKDVDVYDVPIMISKIIDSVGNLFGFYPHEMGLDTDYDIDLGFSERDRFDLAEYIEERFLPEYTTIDIDELLSWHTIYDTVATLINILGDKAELNVIECEKSNKIKVSV